MLRNVPGLLLVLLSAFPLSAGETPPRALSFEDRVEAQRAIEEVYWRHRIWPAENPGSKPTLELVMPVSVLRAKVQDYLEKSSALETWWGRPITGHQLQAEIDRMARATRDPRTLRELFDALGGDAFLIAETLARQTLAERLVRNRYAADERFLAAVEQKVEAPSFDAWWGAERALSGWRVEESWDSFRLPAVPRGECTNDTWVPTAIDVPDPRAAHTAVWTGMEMIVWGGAGGSRSVMNTGARYTPATDTWEATSTGASVPLARAGHTAVWTGTEMIVWGGSGALSFLNSGGRYAPTTDTWTATSTAAGVPVARYGNTAVWTGTEMIVWGGFDPYVRIPVRTGGRYDPSADRWSPTSTGASAPTARWVHTAVWTGTEMIVWGGLSADRINNSGARYDPFLDRWTPTSTGANTPAARLVHSAVWTGTEMIVWGGSTGFLPYPKSGARYEPSTDTWIATSTGPNAPAARYYHTAVWTGREMIVWGGVGGEPGLVLDSGSRYDPSSDRWAVTNTGANVPAGRYEHTVVWTGTEMIVWGGTKDDSYREDAYLDSGARYDPTADDWIPTSTGAGVPPASEWHTAVWTGTEMIVWGGRSRNSSYLDTGGRYIPSIDDWSAVSRRENVPAARALHAAVWTGTEMIVWGGYDGSSDLNSGGRYAPSIDAWIATPTGASVPAARRLHSAVWTGREMIVWGGASVVASTNSGGRFDPSAERWSATSTGASVPSARSEHTAVWTGTEMIVWGGYGGGSALNSGGRYDPSADDWRATGSGASVASPRGEHTAVWTGNEMIVWGGFSPTIPQSTGARYDPSSDLWTATSTGPDLPSGRGDHTAVWTGLEMIVWGGYGGNARLQSGGRYAPSVDSWTPTATDTSVPDGRQRHTAVWTGTEMIVWGGRPRTATGGRYCACPAGLSASYRDADGDGYGNAALSSASCDGSIPPGYVADDTDCDDASPSVHPGRLESCNGIDDDCDGMVDDGGSALCDDGNACTADACDKATGCVHSAGDADGDGIADACDACPASITSPTVLVGACDTRVPNTVLASGVEICFGGRADEDFAYDEHGPHRCRRRVTIGGRGCTISDDIEICRSLARGKRKWKECVEKLTTELRRAHVLTEKQRSRIRRCIERQG